MSWQRIATWDGLLPLGIVCVPSALLFLGANPSFVGLLMVLLPMLAAMIRAHVAHNRIMDICNHSPGFLRQLALALAIVVLLLFEMIVSLMQVMADFEAIMLAIAAGLYLGYLALILFALRPLPPMVPDPLTDPRCYLDDDPDEFSTAPVSY